MLQRLYCTQKLAFLVGEFLHDCGEGMFRVLGGNVGLLSTDPLQLFSLVVLLLVFV